MQSHELSAKSFGGSGYDIACAGHQSPILYQRDLQNLIHLRSNMPSGRLIMSIKSILSIWDINENSRDAIAHYKGLNPSRKPIEAMNELSRSFSQCTSFKDAANLIREHELLMASVLETPCLDDKLLERFCFVSKSLGAWGGDFCMVLFPGPMSDLTNIAAKHGLSTVAPLGPISVLRPLNLLIQVTLSHDPSTIILRYSMGKSLQYRPSQVLGKVWKAVS